MSKKHPSGAQYSLHTYGKWTAFQPISPVKILVDMETFIGY